MTRKTTRSNNQEGQARLMRLERLRGYPKRRFRVTTQRDPLHALNNLGLSEINYDELKADMIDIHNTGDT